MMMSLDLLMMNDIWLNYRDPYYGGEKRHQERGSYRGGGGGGGGGTSSRGGGSSAQQPARDKRVRWFMALFDYDPTTMSPNPDACEEELPFSEGDTIKVSISTDFPLLVIPFPITNTLVKY